uniref:Uncharacterized protein n=1 Tax=Campylaephora sungminbooi TaxID=1896769 RepID=A0A1B0TIE0_9FLOR|nr:hypothetical protein BI106_gp048 [Campylaephora sungminbooi]AKU47479.1 hypothetical protein [Campylaephora sungminbooi]ALN11926.1 hypothetical protein 58 [Campylaephora sungminbooi]
MQSTNSYDQDNLEVYNDTTTETVVDDLAYETPVGWSSICLDQTIHYYIDCNINMAHSRSINS